MTTEPVQTREQIEQAAATWIARRDSGSWAPADQAALEAWLREATGHRVAYLRLAAVWDKTEQLRSIRPLSWVRPMAIAASLALLAVAIGYIVRSGTFLPHPAAPVAPMTRHIETPESQTVQTPPAPLPQAESIGEPPPYEQRFRTAVGASQVVSLPDGSRITLDTDTQLRVTMGARARTVRLDRGQVFFEVSHDASRPFTVRTDRLTVTAVGTAFAVRSETGAVRVVVTEGTVRLKDDQLLSAGGSARVEQDNVQVEQLQPPDLDRALSWRTGTLAFRHSRLADAVDEINRYGGRRILLRDPGIASLEIGGVVRTDDVGSFVSLLEQTLPVDAVPYPDRIELIARRSP